MASFNDWLTVTDPKLFGEGLAARFRLTQNELQKAQEALAPAFALGFQRAMSDPASWSDLSSAFWGLVPGAGSKGVPVLPGALPGQIFTKAFFGSEDLVGAVARHASLFAGIAPDTLQKLMPSLAMLTMQTMVGTTMETLRRNQPHGLAQGDLGSATAEMMRRGANAVEALSHPSDASSSANAFAPMGSQSSIPSLFADALAKSFPWMKPGIIASGPAAPPRPETPAAAFDPLQPFAAMFDAFVQGMTSAAPQGALGPDAASAGAQPIAPSTTSIASKQTGDSVVGDIMRSGHKLHDDYAKEMAALFDRYGRDAKPAGRSV